MAKINVEFDTKEKTMSVTLDGKPVDNVYEVGLYRSYSEDGKFSCAIYTLEKNDNDGTRLMTRLEANEKNPDITKVSSKSSVQQDIERYFGVA